MLVLELQYQVDTSNIGKGDESKPSRLVRALVLQNHTVVYFAEVLEVIAESRLSKIMWESSDKDLAKLRFNVIAAG